MQFGSLEGLNNYSSKGNILSHTLSIFRFQNDLPNLSSIKTDKIFYVLRLYKEIPLCICLYLQK